jgi:hypothetical protein
LGVYRRDGAKTLARALVIVNKSFGDPGLTQEIIDGVALVCQRYNGALQDSDAIARFHDMRGGVGALMHKANVIREQTAQSRPQCVASAAVEILNRGRSKKIPAWFKV